MEKAEQQAEQNVVLNKASAKLSEYMRESWETGRLWLTYASRMSWAFDNIYWKSLNERFFGNRGEESAKLNISFNNGVFSIYIRHWYYTSLRNMEFYF
jgi:hypothetical protein